MSKATKDKKLCNARNKFIVGYFQYCNHCGTKTSGEVLMYQDGLCNKCADTYFKKLDSFKRGTINE